jgi:hypothetical protein
MSKAYGLGISFTTSRELTQDELDHLLSTVAVQIEAPMAFNGFDRASFTVSNCAYDLFSNEATA